MIVSVEDAVHRVSFLAALPNATTLTLQFAALVEVLVLKGKTVSQAAAVHQESYRVVLVTVMIRILKYVAVMVPRAPEDMTASQVVVAQLGKFPAEQAITATTLPWKPAVLMARPVQRTLYVLEMENVAMRARKLVEAATVTIPQHKSAVLMVRTAP